MQYPMSDAHIPRDVTMHHITATTALDTYGYEAFVYQHKADWGEADRSRVHAEQANHCNPNLMPASEILPGEADFFLMLPQNLLNKYKTGLISQRLTEFHSFKRAYSAAISND